MKFQLLINTGYGGFSIPVEMVLWLHENKKWILPEKNKYGSDESKFYDWNENYFGVKNPSIEFRSNPELIIAYCLCKLKWAESAKKQRYSERKSHQFSCLKLMDVNVYIDVQNYCDGKEEIMVTHYEEENIIEHKIREILQ